MDEAFKLNVNTELHSSLISIPQCLTEQTHTNPADSADSNVADAQKIESSYVTQLPIMISVFNQKSGVGRATATYEMGYTLSKVGFNVLMIDADPQASLTTIIHPELASDNKRIEEFNHKLNQNKEKNNSMSRIDDIFEPALSLTKHNYVPIQRAKNVQILPVHHYKGLFYLPGSIRFSQLNKMITLDIGNVPDKQSLVNMVPDLFKEIGKLNSIDIILADLNPSIDGINESVIMNSDYLFIPFKPSSGCLESVKNLIEVFPTWFKELRNFKHLAPNQGPLLLGTFPQITRRPIKDKDDNNEMLEISHEALIKAIFNKTNCLLTEFISYMGSMQKSIPFAHYKDHIGFQDMVAAANFQEGISGHPMSDLSYSHLAIEKGCKKSFRKRKLRDQWNQVKRKINTAYRKILAVYFNFLKDEHKQALLCKVPGFIETLNLYHSLNIDSERRIPSASSQEEKNENTKKRKRKIYGNWYTDKDISKLLEEVLKNKIGYYFTTPMQGIGRFTESQLTDNIKQYLLNIIVDQQIEKNKTVFIPLNVGQVSRESEEGKHWILAIVRFHNNLDEIFYFDPLNNCIPYTVNNALTKAVNAVFNKKIVNISRLEGMSKIQTDSYNCGPWLIEAALTIAKGEPLSSLNQKDDNYINNRRAYYAGILRTKDQDDQLQTKRQKKQFTSSSVKQLQQRRFSSKVNFFSSRSDASSSSSVAATTNTTTQNASPTSALSSQNVNICNTSNTSNTSNSN